MQCSNEVIAKQINYDDCCYGFLCCFFKQMTAYEMIWGLEFRRVLFFFQAEDGIRDDLVTGVQTCALPILLRPYKIKKRRAVCWSLVAGHYVGQSVRLQAQAHSILLERAQYIAPLQNQRAGATPIAGHWSRAHEPRNCTQSFANRSASDTRCDG